MRTGWQCPSVPPPHDYFPAMVRLLQPESDAAVTALLAQAGVQAAAAFRSTWDLDEHMRLPADADPLRQVR